MAGRFYLNNHSGNIHPEYNGGSCQANFPAEWTEVNQDGSPLSPVQDAPIGEAEVSQDGVGDYVAGADIEAAIPTTRKKKPATEAK